MTIRPGPLRAAAALAVGFVVVRVVYRVLFHGADGSGQSVLPLPELRLAPPFAHVVMFGPVTLDGLWDAAASALPIAAGILALGLLNALVDVARVVARVSRRGPLRGVGRALAIAWATLPSLADAARAVRLAQRLRGERGGVRMLSPLLQRTLERAGNVAAALELRGFAGQPRGGVCEAPVEARSVWIGFPRGVGAARGVRLGDLALPPASLTVLSGHTGSGKSTVLRALAGLHSHTDGGQITGELRVVGHDRVVVPPRDLAQRVGVVLQHPRDAFTAERVRDEVGLALELRGVARVLVAARVAEVAERVGVTALLDRPVRTLSAGEATLVAIAAAIVEHPILLLVDEPLADLDADARGRVVRVLDALAHEAGVCVVVAEHRVEALTDIADRHVRITDGVVRDGTIGLDSGSGVSLVSASAPPSDSLVTSALSGSSRSGVGRVSSVRGGSSAPRTERPEPWVAPAERDTGATRGVALRANRVTVRHRGAIAVDAASLALHPGEVVALVGPNGAGKSSLLAALALPDRAADVEAAGRVALVPDASDDLFVYDTVAAECARADRRAAKARRGVLDTRGSAERFAGFLRLDVEGPEFAARLARHPLDLSVGERRCLALAIQLATEPRVLLVDEPTRGLDPVAREVVWRALASLADTGTAVLVASHEPEIAARADRILPMRAGVVGAHAPSSAVLHADRAPAFARAETLETGVRTRPAAYSRPQTGPAPATRPTPADDREPRIGRRARGRQVSRRLATFGGHVTAVGGTRAALGGFVVANLIALGAFCWPLVATAVPQHAHAAVPIAALALAPLAALVVIATLDGTVRSAHMLALLATLSAIGAAVRIASTGVGGVEALFILLILAGRAFGARFGLLLGMSSIALSTVVTGTFGPWTPFQMFACGWVGAAAGLLPRRIGRTAEIALLCLYGVVAAYVFGLLMNLWFWPFAVGFGTGISYDGGAPLDVNLSSFLLYSLVTSTLSWDTLRAITTVVGILVVGKAVLAALRRAKPLQSCNRGV